MEFPDEASYSSWLAKSERDWESLCQNCGACCGVLEDPCEHLRKDSSGVCSCAVYDRRFDAEHKTLSGAPLRCVPIRGKLHQSWPGDERCGYRRK